MTANELIDKLESVSIRLFGKETEHAGRAIILYRESAIMLQQQANEIAMLKQIIDANNLKSDVGQFIRPIDEPVAHRFKWEEKEEWQYGDGYDATGAPNDPDYFAYEPLYTHPAKTLTDDEMELAYYECFDLKNKMPDNEKRRSYFKFARTILRKAQEK